MNDSGFKSKLSLFIFLNGYFRVQKLSYAYYQSKSSQNQLSVERYNELRTELIRLINLD